MRILVADDHQPVRRFVCNLLEAEDWEVCGEAVNGREAVEMAIQLEPDVVVLDLSMPEMNGLAAARQILRTAPQTNVLILTLHEGEDLTRAVLEAGAGACVSKTDLHCLVKEVRTLFNSYRSRATNGAPAEQAQPVDENLDRPDPALTVNEQNILQLLALSKTNREIATALSMSLKSVEHSRSRIMDKLGVDTVVDCIRYAIRKRA